MNKNNALLYLPLVQALAEGKTIQVGDSEGSCWTDASEPLFTGLPPFYRIKPEPVMVPLGPEDVPPGSAIRSQEGYWSIVTRSDGPGLQISSRGTSIPWDELLTYWQIKRPGQDWMACSKIAE